jgi:hypothetical protein
MMRREDMLAAPFASAADPRGSHQFGLPCALPLISLSTPISCSLSTFGWDALAEPNNLFPYFTGRLLTQTLQDSFIAQGLATASA